MKAIFGHPDTAFHDLKTLEYLYRLQEKEFLKMG